MSMQKLKLGTRKSLLAWAQSTWVAQEIEKFNPGVQVELVGIETRGDRIQTVSLQKVEGKDFFVAELDHALQSGAVDLTVHSMKDLSLTRPSDLVCAAIPRRENPRDVVLFSPQALQRLRAGEVLKIGTSSPRRQENIPHFLERALPHFGSVQPRLQWLDIRGNVNTRLSRVHEPTDSERYLDGVVLAFAGLIRLWTDPAGRAELARLLQGVRWMILPLKECPAAPAQGALAVECRQSDPFVQTCIQKLHSTSTAIQVAHERALLAEWGGGCHQRFGATEIEHAELGAVLYIRGAKSNGEFVEETRWRAPPAALDLLKKQDMGGVRKWDGSFWRSSGGSEVSFQNDPLSERLMNDQAEKWGSAVFVAHARASQGRLEELQNSRVWTSGVSSWFKLARQGVWVEGCAENLGFHAVIPILKEAVIGLPSFNQWKVFTHANALSEWEDLGITAIPTYKINLIYGTAAKSALQAATHVFWSSGSQYDELKGYMAKNAHQACGPGKTADRLRRDGVNPILFPSVEVWRDWLRTGQNESVKK